MARTPRAEDAPLLRGGGRRETSDAPGPAVWLSIGMLLAGLMVLAIGAAPWGRAHVALVNGALYHPDTASTTAEVRRAEVVAPDGTETHARAPSPPEREGDQRDPSALGEGDGERDDVDEMDERDAVFSSSSSSSSGKEKGDARGARGGGRGSNPPESSARPRPPPGR